MRWRDHLVDARPITRLPAFRAFWAGSTVSSFGGQLSSFAVLYDVWHVSRSAPLVGLVGLVQAVPLVAFGLAGGHVADRVNRRALLIGTRVAQAVVTAVTAAVVLALPRSLVPLFVLVGIASGLAAVSAPLSNTLAPRLLPPEQLAAGIAIMRLSSQFAALGGPLVAGVVVATAGVGPCFLLDAATFVAALGGVRGVPAEAGVPRGGGPGAGGGAVLAAVRFARRTPVVRAAFLIDLTAMVFALPLALFPVINAERFGGSPLTLGLLVPAIGAGGILAGLLSGRITRSAHQGRVMLASCGLWGAAILAFGLVPSLPLALAALVVAGAADTGTVVSRGTIVQHATPDALRGRMNALDFLVGAGGPSLGGLRAGLVAGAIGGPASAALGGAVCVALTGVIAASNRAARQWRTPG